MEQSTITLAELKTRAEDLLDLTDNSDLKDITVAIAVNDFLRMYTPEEWRAFPDVRKLEETHSIGESGLLLSTITDLGSTSVGFDIRNESGMKLFPVRKNSGRYGYRISDGTLFIVPSPSSSATYTIRYFPEITKYDITDLPEFEETTIPVLSGMEEGLEFMVAYRYTRKDQSDPQLAVNYKNDAMTEINKFIKLNKGSAYISN